MSPRSRAIAGAVAVTALLGAYVAAVGTRVVTLVRTGEPVAVAMGLAAGVLPVVVVWLVWREWRLARVVDRMANRLESEGGLEPDDLPRSPGGRIDREAARQRFEDNRRQAERTPEDWRVWFRLGWAYDAAGDRRRARAALRAAARLYQQAQAG